MIKNNYNYVMNINIEEYNNVAAFLPGLYKFQESDLFFQAIIGLTDKTLNIYNDHAPDSKTEDTLTYKVKVRIPLNSIKAVANERIINNKDMAGLGRLKFIVPSENKSYLFYYFLDTKKKLKLFLDLLKHNGLKPQNRKVDLARE